MSILHHRIFSKSLTHKQHTQVHKYTVKFGKKMITLCRLFRDKFQRIYDIKIPCRSAYTEAFIDTITAPVSDKIDVQDHQRVRRASLDQVFEEGSGDMGVIGGGILSPVSIDSTMPMSYSADDLKQLQEDADALGPSKWKKFGIAAR